jgi:predicted CoA-binding protein
VHASIGWNPSTEQRIPRSFGSGPVSTNEILERYKTIAVVGLSSQPWRPSYSVSQYMQAAGYRIIPVNPHETDVLGETAYPSLDDVPESFEIVNIFRRAEFVPEVVEGAIRRNACVVWMQLGVVNEVAAARARDAGLQVVMDRCILQEHALHFR